MPRLVLLYLHQEGPIPDDKQYQCYYFKALENMVTELTHGIDLMFLVHFSTNPLL